MELFYGGGGNQNPDFCYRFLVENVTNEMYTWCQNYPLNGPFERWYVKYRHRVLDYQGGQKELPLIQIENKNAAFMFKLAFSEFILKDETYDFAKDRYEDN